MPECTLLKLIKLLRGTGDSLTRDDIAEKIGEAQDYVEKALEKLVENNMVNRDGEFYSYRNTPTNEEFSQKILAVYDKVAEMSILKVNDQF